MLCDVREHTSDHPRGLPFYLIQSFQIFAMFKSFCWTKSYMDDRILGFGWIFGKKTPNGLWPPQKHQVLHTLEHTIVPWTVIFTFSPNYTNEAINPKNQATLGALTFLRFLVLGVFLSAAYHFLDHCLSAETCGSSRGTEHPLLIQFSEADTFGT